MSTSNDSIYQVAPQDAFFKAGVENVLANTSLTPAAQATAINQLIGGTYGGDTSKAYAAFGGANLDAATKSAYDTFLSQGQPYVAPTYAPSGAATDFRSVATNILNNSSLSPQAQATAINLALAANNLTREQGALMVNPLAYGTAAGMDAVNSFLNQGGTGVVGSGVPSSLTDAVAFINKNSGLQEQDILDLARAYGLNYNPITDVLYNPKTNEATKIDASKLGTTYYGADNPLTKEVENYAPGTPGYIQAFINRLAVDNPTLTSADFKKIAEEGYKIPAGSFRADPSGTTKGSIVINGITYTIPKGSTSSDVKPTVVGGTGNDFRSTLVGGSGVDFLGSTGLREAYGPYVTDYLSRISALLAARDAEDYKPRKFGTKAKGILQDFDPYGTETAELLEELAKERKTRRTTPYKGRKFTFAKKDEDDEKDTKSAATGGIMSLVDHYDDGGFVASTFNTPTGTYQQSSYDPTKASGYVAPGTYQPGTIGNTFDATKAGAYTGPEAGKEITSKFATPTGLYTPGTIGNTFDATKAGAYTAPIGKDTITSTYTDPANLYKAGNIGSTYDPNTGLYTGPGKGITTETFDAAALQRLMSPYMSGVVDPQVREARRQAEITRMQNAARMAKAGSFGGSRQAIQESELNRNLATQLEDIYGKGQQGAFDAALRAFEAEQGRKLQAATATETARQEAGRQALTGEEAETRFGLQAATAQEAAKQAAGQQALTAATTGAELSQRGQIAQEAARQAAGQQALSAAQTAGQLGLQAATAQEAARQTAGQQALSAAQTAGQLGLQAATAQEAARQTAGQQALSAAQTAGQLGLQGQIAQEAARQAAGQQALSAAEIAGRLGLQGSELSERSRQFAAQYGLDVAKTSAQYEQQARELQQRAEEAAARGDQFAADLALRELQENQRAAEATRAFEYQQERDVYLDPYREALYASQALSGLPITASSPGVSSATEAIIAALGLNKVIGG
jgi:hypothetical protein